MSEALNTCTAFGLTISLKKTKAMFTPAPGVPYNELNIVINDTRLDVVDTFVYRIGNTLSRNGSLDTEILAYSKSICCLWKVGKENIV